MKIGFTGTQKGLSENQEALLIYWLLEYLPLEVHHGMCIGADTELHNLVTMYRKEGLLSKDCKIIGHPPTNKGKAVFSSCDEYRESKDYINRNHDIVDESDIIIACPLEDTEVLRSGTWATIRYARKLDKKVIIIRR